jgi:4a-hydroxytetrahydrobiopterin dehydratase
MMRTFGVEEMEAPEGWEIVDGRLMSEYEFENFAQAKQFIDRVSVLSEQEDHHPELHFGWGYAVIELFTHDIGAVTKADIALAEKISLLEK